MKLDLLYVRKDKKKKKKQKRLAASCSILGFVKNDKETSCTGTVTATPFPGRSGPPAQSTESNSITTAAGDLTNATLTITDDIIEGIGIENYIVMNVYSALQTQDDENEIKNSIDTETNR